MFNHAYVNYSLNNGGYNYMPYNNFNYYPASNMLPWMPNFLSTGSLTTNNANYLDYNLNQHSGSKTGSSSQATISNPTFTSNKLNIETKEKEEKEKEEGLSSGAKWGIGIGIVAAVALGVEIFAFKGRHLNSLKNKFLGCVDDIAKTTNSTKNQGIQNSPSVSSSLVGSQNINDKIEFSNLDEAKSWFENFGINAEFKNVNDSDLGNIKKFANNFKELKRLGVAVNSPDSLVISDWSNVEELSRLYTERQIPHEIEFLQNHTGFWGRAQKGLDGKNHVFLNSNMLTTCADKNIIAHEIGHHCRMSDNTVLKMLDSANDINRKRLEILGYPTEWPHKDIFFGEAEAWLTDKGPIFGSGLTSTGKPSKNSVFLSGEGVTELFKNEIEKTYAYNDYQADEFVADIFKGLTTGKTYSDDVMLAYDFIGGGRVPNLMINGDKYDDYIKKLYENNELIRKLKERVSLSRVSDVNIRGEMILEKINI